MNREIKFRGQRVDNNGWVYGYYVISRSRHEGYDETGCWFLIYVDIDDFEESECYKVIPETVGQFTGVLDKNKKEVYEGDVISVNNKKADKVVSFTDGAFFVGDRRLYQTMANFSEVIGNIYENKNLLTENKQ